MQDKVNDVEHGPLASAKARLDELQSMAVAMCDEHWSDLKRANKAKEFDDKSRLFPRIGKSKYSFRIEWYHIQKWYKNFRGQWKKVTRYIALGKGYRYRLNKYAKDWEIDSLNEFEDRASLIRQEAELLDSLIKGYERMMSKSAPAESAQLVDESVESGDVDGAE